MFGFDDMLMGAAIGGGLNLLTGKNPLQGALLGGVGGGLLGGLKNANFLQSSAAKAIPTTAAQFESSMGLPSSAFYAAGGQGMAGANTLASMGMVPGVAGNMVDASSYLGAGMPWQTYKGGEGLLSNAYSNVKEYMTPQNLMGVANVLSSAQPSQLIPAQSGSVRQGSTSGLNVNMGMAAPITLRKREDF